LPWQQPADAVFACIEQVDAEALCVQVDAEALCVQVDAEAVPAALSHPDAFADAFFAFLSHAMLFVYATAETAIANAATRATAVQVSLLLIDSSYRGRVVPKLQ